MKKKYQKNKKNIKDSQKNNDMQKIEKKRGAKVEQYLEEHIESAIWDMFVCADFRHVPNHISAVHITWYIKYLERENASN